MPDAHASRGRCGRARLSRLRWGGGEYVHVISFHAPACRPWNRSAQGPSDHEGVCAAGWASSSACGRWVWVPGRAVVARRADVDDSRGEEFARAVERGLDEFEGGGVRTVGCGPCV